MRKDRKYRENKKYSNKIPIMMCLFVIGIVFATGFALSDQKWINNDPGVDMDKRETVQAGWREDDHDRNFHVVARQKEAERVAVREAEKAAAREAEREAERLAKEKQLAAKAVKLQSNSAASRNIDVKPVIPQPKYKIDVSISEQKVRVYYGETLVKEWIVSTGVNNCTPLGNFTTKDKGVWFFSDKYQQGGMWWISFLGDYLFHSVPMDRNQNIIPEEAEKLGMPSSHGCIRLEVEHAKWLYDNIPRGTPVFIHN